MSIYCASNPYLTKDLYKIQYEPSNVNYAIDKLYIKDTLPSPFEIVMQVSVDDPNKLEQLYSCMEISTNIKRINDSDFFHGDIQEIRKYFDLLANKSNPLKLSGIHRENVIIEKPISKTYINSLEKFVCENIEEDNTSAVLLDRKDCENSLKFWLSINYPDEPIPIWIELKKCIKSKFKRQKYTNGWVGLKIKYIPNPYIAKFVEERIIDAEENCLLRIQEVTQEFKLWFSFEAPGIKMPKQSDIRECITNICHKPSKELGGWIGLKINYNSTHTTSNDDEKGDLDNDSY